VLTAGGIFEEAIAVASLLLDRDCAVAETVRSAELIDATWQVAKPFSLAKWARSGSEIGLCLNLNNKLAALAMDRQIDGYVLDPNNVLAALTIIT
jgi:hypothetical protein